MNMRNLLAHKKRTFFIGLVALIGGIVLWAAIVYVYQAPRDIGDKIEYLGQRDYGCAPFPLSFVCFSPPSTEYYFSTTLTQDELKTHFRYAHYKTNDPLKTSDGGGAVRAPDGRDIDYSFKDIVFVDKNNQRFVITYYDNKEAMTFGEHLRQADKPYIISMDPESYLLARSAQ